MSFNRIPPSWGHIESQIDEQEYPSSEVTETYLPPNTGVIYSASNLIYHLLKTTKNHSKFLINRHGLSLTILENSNLPSEEIQRLYQIEDLLERYKEYEKIVRLLTIDNIDEVRDDIIFYNEDDTDFYVLWFDKTGRNSLYRLSKETFPLLTMEELVRIHNKYLCEIYCYWNFGGKDSYKEAIILEISKA